MVTEYTPFTCTITGITQDVQAVVTTSEDHGFIIGNTVRFYIPQDYGMKQLDQIKASIVDYTINTLTVNVDTRNFNAFSIPVSPQELAQVVPLGDMNIGFNSIVPNPITIPGAFAQVIT